MSKLTRRVFLGTGAAAVAVAASPLIHVKKSNAQSKEVNIYSSRHYNTDQRLYDDFTSQTGIKVNLIEGKGDPLIERIRREGSRSPADILITVDAGRLWRATQAGIFTPVNSSILNQKIPDYLRDSKGLWFSFSKRLRVIMYSKERVNPSSLSSYADLANSKWKGKVLIRSSSNIYNQSFVAWLIDVKGQQAAEQWCRGVVSNFARSPQGNDTAQMEAIAAGVGDLALVNTYYLAKLADSSDPARRQIFDKVGAFFPDQNGRGAHANVSGAGLVKNAPNKEAGIKFLEYLVSPSAQAFFAQGNHEYPVVSGVKPDPVLQKLGSFKSDVASVANFGPNTAKAVQIMNRSGWK
ncbi:MAG: Fe(3+) ABC transporter substrate-binding protein [Microcystaceae cyanobacterium]